MTKYANTMLNCLTNQDIYSFLYNTAIQHNTIFQSIEANPYLTNSLDLGLQIFLLRADKITDKMYLFNLDLSTWMGNKHENETR